MPTHCTITRFGFRTRRIDGVECGLFSNHVPLGQTALRVGRVSIIVNESLENEQSSFSKLSFTSPTSQLILILQAFHHFTYVTAHSPTLPSLYLRHNPFSNPSLALPTSQLILQPFFRLSYVTGFSPGEPPMIRYAFVSISSDVKSAAYANKLWCN